ncbi:MULTISPECIES: polysaccharide deacetylase family protein [Peribacillus]|nr:polysaccharide deacetylase family protein [Peribacillus frigoritolerans]
MYHSISEGDGLRVPSEEFRSPDETFLVLTESRMPSEKCVWLTFDDGYTGSYTEAFPILKENDAKATVFMIGKSIDKGHHLTENQMLEMSRNGISIESHTINLLS